MMVYIKNIDQKSVQRLAQIAYESNKALRDRLIQTLQINFYSIYIHTYLFHPPSFNFKYLILK